MSEEVTQILPETPQQPAKEMSRLRKNILKGTGAALLAVTMATGVAASNNNESAPKDSTTAHDESANGFEPGTPGQETKEIEQLTTASTTGSPASEANKNPSTTTTVAAEQSPRTTVDIVSPHETPKTTTTEAARPAYELAAERMAHREVDTEISYLATDVTFQPGTALSRGPSKAMATEAAAEKISFINVEYYKDEKGAEWVCANKLDGSVVCSSDFANMTRVVDGVDIPFAAADVPLVSSVIAEVNSSGLASVETEEGMIPVAQQAFQHSEAL